MTSSLQARHRRKAEAGRKLLESVFPLCFLPRKMPKRPLKIRIDQDIRLALPELARGDMALAMADYCGGPTYLRAMIVGAERIDLNGNPAGTVTAEEAEYAAGRLKAFEARFCQPREAA